MKNFIQNGENITVIAPADVSSGDGVQVGQIVGIATDDALDTEPVVIKRTGVFSVTKTSAQAWTVGQNVYWDDSASEFTTTEASNKLVGLTHTVAANPSDTGEVLLTGQAG